MKKLVLATTLVVFTIGTARAADKPNVIVILTDDMGYADLPMFGDSEIPAPNLRRLADSGVKLTNAHVSAPICVPSRMGLLTGRYQHRFGIYDNVYSPDENRLWIEERTLANELKTHGYRTANVGKWHLSGNGKLPWTLPAPHERGFDEFVGIEGGMDDSGPEPRCSGSRATNTSRSTRPNTSPISSATKPSPSSSGPRQNPRTRNQKREPFFLYLAFNAPHAPLQALEEDQAAIDADWISPERRIYGGMVVAVDRNVGRVLDALQQHGLRDNTLVVFLNDNGGGGNNAAAHTRNTAATCPTAATSSTSSKAACARR